MKQNKKAQLGHGITWLWKFILLVLVLGGVVAVVVSHYSKQFDIRDAEAYVVSGKIVECLAPKGIVSNKLILNKETIVACIPLDENELYINISLDENNTEVGKSFLATLCQATEQKIAVKVYPACLKESYHILKQTSTGVKSSILNIFIAIRKVEKNL